MKLFRLNLLVSIVISLQYLPFINSRLNIIRYNHMGTLYAYRLQTERFPPDPLETCSMEGRQKICDEVLTASMFIRLSINDVLPALSNTEYINLAAENIQRYPFSHGTSAQVDLKYSHAHIHIGRGDRPLTKIFPCVYKPSKMWFVAFALEKDQMFLIEKDNTRFPLLKITALIESTSSFSDKGRTLQRYFAEQIQRGSNSVPTDIPDDMKLHNVHKDHHMRICSSVFETMSRPENGYFKTIVKKVNYVRARFHKIKKKSFRVGEYPFIYEIITDVLPCSINEELPIPQFYLLADPSKKGAAFVFMNGLWGKDQIYLVEHVQDIPVMLEPQNTFLDASNICDS